MSPEHTVTAEKMYCIKMLSDGISSAVGALRQRGLLTTIDKNGLVDSEMGLFVYGC